MKITVFGAGYVGLVAAACLADAGNDVICADTDEKKIALLRQGTVPLYEPGLEEVIKRNLASKRIDFTTDMRRGVEQSRFLFAAVGTPSGPKGEADTRQIYALVDSIGKYINDDKIVIMKSTVPVGTSGAVRARLFECRAKDVNVDVVSNPEFLKEGSAIADFTNPDRIVIGCDNPQAGEAMRALYAPFVKGATKLLVMDTRSAELTKLAANAMLAARISFMNEIANIAEYVGADVEKIKAGIGSDTRIGSSFINPGCGYGGSCFPKDILALMRAAQNVGIETEMLNAIDSVNQKQKRTLCRKLEAYFGSLQGRTFAVWGLAFKPNTNDIREAASLTLLEMLWQRGATVRAYDPAAMEEVRKVYGPRPDLILCDNRDEALEGADALVLVTEWPEFRNPDLARLKTALNHPVVFDGRNIYDPTAMHQAGFKYFGTGRGDNWRGASVTGSTSVSTLPDFRRSSADPLLQLPANSGDAAPASENAGAERKQQKG